MAMEHYAHETLSQTLRPRYGHDVATKHHAAALAARCLLVGRQAVGRQAVGRQALAARRLGLLLCMRLLLRVQAQAPTCARVCAYSVHMNIAVHAHQQDHAHVC